MLALEMNLNKRVNRIVQGGDPDEEEETTDSAGGAAGKSIQNCCK